MLTSMRSFVGAIGALIFGVVLLLGQVEQGTILGTVSDPQGARVPNAEVTFTNQDTNIRVQSRTGADGDFRSTPLRPGVYTVSAEAPGFKSVARSGIRVEIQQEVRLNLLLDIGATSEAITVSASASLLQTTEASRGQVVDSKKIVDLPLNGRDYLQLALLTAGTNVPPPGARFGGFSSGGMRVSHNNYLLDGMDNNSNQHAAQGRTPQVIAPSVDAIQEFKVQTGNYSAEFGRNVGGVVNAVIKSGTNQFHGGIFEFLRNEAMNARNFFQSSPNKPIFRRNQFGGLIGGPIVRNKTFFFVDYEGTLQRTQDTVLSTIPTEQERNGIFSQPVYDPLTHNPTTRERQPFPNNTIPLMRQDPVGRLMLSYFPLPNRPGAINNYLSNPSLMEDTHKGDVRVDHTFDEKQTVYGRLSYQRFLQTGEGTLPAPAWGGGDESSTNENNALSFVVSYQRIFTPNVFNTLKVGFNRLLTERASPVDQPLNQEIGLRGTESVNGFALFNITGYRSVGPPANNPQFSDSQTRQLTEDLLWTRGRHTWKFGGNLMFLQSPHRQAFQSNGVFTFSGNFARQFSDRGVGNALADVLLGYPTNSQISNVAQGNQRRRIHGFYAQDDWKVSDRLTVNLGLRWEYVGPWFEKYNRYANFDIDSSRTNPQLLLARDGGIADRSTLSPDFNNFGPRIGLALRLDSRTVIRSGYGIYYGGVDHIGDRYLHAGPPFFFQSGFNTDNITPSIVLRDGFPPGAFTQRVTNLQTISQGRNNPTTYAQHWNFTMQRELGRDIAVEAGYVGTKGNRLLQRFDSNAPDPGPGNINARRPVTMLDVPGIGIVTPLADTFRREFSGNSNYHALQGRVEKRFSYGLSFLTSYVWSKTISDSRGGADAGGTAPNAVQDFKNLRAEKSLADEHFPHRFVSSVNYDLPFGRGRAMMTGAPALVNAILGGWSVGGIVTLVSGRMVNIGVQGDPANVGSGAAVRPDVVAGQSPNLDSSERSLGRWFNTGAFVRQTGFTFGNAGRNLVTAPDRRNLDLAIYKAFQFGESRSLQLRGEFFNASNTPFFGAPGNTLGTAQFGVINSAGDARIAQVAAKLYF